MTSRMVTYRVEDARAEEESAYVRQVTLVGRYAG